MIGYHNKSQQFTQNIHMNTIEKHNQGNVINLCDIHSHTWMINNDKLVVRSNSANAWRASRPFLQKNRTEITSNCSAQCNPFNSQLASENLKSLIPDYGSIVVTITELLE